MKSVKKEVHEKTASKAFWLGSVQVDSQVWEQVRKEISEPVLKEVHGRAARRGWIPTGKNSKLDWQVREQVCWHVEKQMQEDLWTDK